MPWSCDSLPRGKERKFLDCLTVLDIVTTTQHEKQKRNSWLIAQIMVFLVWLTHWKAGHALFKNLKCGCYIIACASSISHGRIRKMYAKVEQHSDKWSSDLLD